MYRKILNVILSLLLFFAFYASYTFSHSALAMTPEDYCKIHDDSGAPGTCEAKGNCVVITTNLGTEECKKCSDGGCEMEPNCDNLGKEAKTED